MGALNIEIKGLEKILKNLSDLDKVKIPRAMAEALAKSGEYVLGVMRSNTPVDTGNLKESEQVFKGINRVEIGPDLDMADYAYYVERGHHTVSGSWVPGQFYVLRTAMETRKGVKSFFDKVFKSFIT